MVNRRAYGEVGHSIGIIALVATILTVQAVALLASGTTSTFAQERKFALNSLVASTLDTSLLEQPATSSAEVAPMPVNSIAIVVGGPFNEGFYWLDFNGIKGYVQDRVLVLVDQNYRPVTPAPATPTPTATAGPTSPTATPSPVPTIVTRPGSYDGLWLGALTNGGNVRVGPGTNQRVLKGWPAGRRVLLYETAQDSNGGAWYRVSEPPEPPMYVHASLISKIAPVQFEPARYRGKWININVSQQIVTAYVDGTPAMVTLTSTGTAKNPTELGIWKIYYRLPKQDMDGGSLASADYYNLKDVPWVQYFHMSGEGLHGTYWHDDFGRPRSHGCVNLSTPIAEWFYKWANIGTIVYVHR